MDPGQNDDEVARKLQWVAHHCPKLRYLVLEPHWSNSRNLTEAIKAIARGCSELNHLNVSHKSVDDEVMEAVAQGCPQLKELDLSLIHISEPTRR